jgi:aromatic ring hydroxylase
LSEPIAYRDWINPEEQPFIEKYLSGKAGVPTEYRLKAIRLLLDITNGKHYTHTIHAEGSLAAQQMMFYNNADWELYKATAKRNAGIPGWENNPEVGKLKDLSSLLNEKMPPIDKTYKLKY